LRFWLVGKKKKKEEEEESRLHRNKEPKRGSSQFIMREASAHKQTAAWRLDS
jgi:hypothetical protein